MYKLDDVITIQRVFRKKLRYQENIKRMNTRTQNPKTVFEAKNIVANANRPYKPQNCSNELANAIKNAAKKITLFSSVVHYTSRNHLMSKLDDGLFGQDSLKKLKMNFDPASLRTVDIRNGDGNVICFAANEVDIKSKQGLELKFDSEKLIKTSQPFFKQQDLALFLNPAVYCATIGGEKFYFNHRESINDKSGMIRFALYSENKDTHPKVLGIPCKWEPVQWQCQTLATSYLENDYLISYNTEKMHQILILNFFRFIDKLDDQTQTKRIYAAFERVRKSQGEVGLGVILKEIAIKMTETMEFNYYGAHLIDFSTLISIATASYDKHGRVEEKNETNIQDLIKQLQNNNFELLTKVNKQISDLFKSYRFLDYLLDNLNINTEGYNKIIALRNACNVETDPKASSSSSKFFSFNTSFISNSSQAVLIEPEENICKKINIKKD